MLYTPEQLATNSSGLPAVQSEIRKNPHESDAADSELKNLQIKIAKREVCQRNILMYWSVPSISSTSTPDILYKKLT